MRVVLANLSNKPYEKSRLNLNRSARKYGISDIRSYDFEKDIIPTPFFERHRSILSHKRGVGYWLWKPHIIIEVMKSLEEGDIVIYADCGIEIIDNLDPLVQLCKEQEPILLFANHNFLNAQFTKRDCFVEMGCDEERYWYSLQCDAAFMLFRKTKFTMHFLSRWLQYCQSERVLTDLPNEAGKDDLPGFVDHRHDQSVISLLAEKYHINLYRKPSHSCSVVLPLKNLHTKQFFTKKPVLHKHLAIPAYAAAGLTEPMEKSSTIEAENELVTNLAAYSYIISYLNSRYGRLIYHHRLKNPGVLKRLQMRLVIQLVKWLKTVGYRLEKIEPHYA